MGKGCGLLWGFDSGVVSITLRETEEPVCTLLTSGSTHVDNVWFSTESLPNGQTGQGDQAPLQEESWWAPCWVWLRRGSGPTLWDKRREFAPAVTSSVSWEPQLEGGPTQVLLDG